MKYLAFRFLAAGLTFCIGLTCTGLYRTYTAYQHNLLIERQNKLKRELFLAREHEIDSLLDHLRHSSFDIVSGPNIIVQGPGPEAWQHVHDRLLEIATESAQGRSQVIAALIRVLEKPISEERPFITVEPWTTAVNLLGDLRATEAIDILVKNMGETGANFYFSSYNPVGTAIIKIGEPAVPRLIEALSDERPWIRLEAASALTGIGQPAIARLKEAIHNGNAETKGGAALALTSIQGEEARTALEHAIDDETDQEILSELKDPIKWARRQLFHQPK